MKRMRAWLAIGLAVACTGGAAIAGELRPAPFVGCASDGQMDARPPPKQAREAPRLPADEAKRLAFYASPELGVLAPRGWHCFGLYGSDGAILIVTPEAHTGDDLLSGRHGLTGPAIQVDVSIGGTSGRSEVADVAAGLFPAGRAFVREAAAMHIDPIEPVKPTAADRIVGRSAKRIRYVTAAGQLGLGTRSRLVPSRDPIYGAYILDLSGDVELLELNVRLPTAQAALRSEIIGQFEKDRGDSRATDVSE